MVKKQRDWRKCLKKILWHMQPGCPDECNKLMRWIMDKLILFRSWMYLAWSSSKDLVIELRGFCHCHQGKYTATLSRSFHTSARFSEFWSAAHFIIGHSIEWANLVCLEKHKQQIGANTATAALCSQSFNFSYFLYFLFFLIRRMQQFADEF